MALLPNSNDFAEDDPEAGSYEPTASRSSSSSEQKEEKPGTSSTPPPAEETQATTLYTIPPMPVRVRAKNGQTLGLFFGQQFYFSNFHPASFELDGESFKHAGPIRLYIDNGMGERRGEEFDSTN